MEMGAPGSAAEQSPEEIRRLVVAAAVKHRAVAGWYDGARRFLCPHVVGYNQPGEWRVFCYQYGGETKRTTAERRWGNLALPFADQALQRGVAG